jgi:hypothetical protein
MCEGVASLYCEECDENMCESCSQKIHSMRLYRHHKMSAGPRPAPGAVALAAAFGDDHDQGHGQAHGTGGTGGVSTSMSISPAPSPKSGSFTGAGLRYCDEDTCREVARFTCRQVRSTEEARNPRRDDLGRTLEAAAAQMYHKHAAPS